MNRALLDQLFPPTALARNTGTVQFDPLIGKCRDRRRCGWLRASGRTDAVCRSDYIHNEGPQLDRYDLNPALKVDTTRTGRSTAPI